MAIHTLLPIEDADRIARAHGLGAARGVEGVVAGSVNSNFLLDTDARRVFVRIYEEQDVDGVAYEWALLAHLAEAGVPVPRRVEGTEPGALRVADKPIAVFETIAGHEVCQAMVTEARARAVGAALASAHLAGAGFERRAGRFGRDDIRARLEGVAALERPELREAVATLTEALDELDATLDEHLPRGVVHGDLFRDNVRWEGERILAILDWESAADGTFVFDLAVTTLAWCYGDALDRGLMAAMRSGYRESLRPLSGDEAEALPLALADAAVRFTVTRITDFHLRPDAEIVQKDWRRFYRRLLEVRGLR